MCKKNKISGNCRVLNFKYRFLNRNIKSILSKKITSFLDKDPNLNKREKKKKSVKNSLKNDIKAILWEIVTISSDLQK